jgi:CBS domain containing-hemolysin-like protein
MELLIIFFLTSVIVSFVCSVLESVLLSVNISYVSVLEKEKPKVGKLLRKHKENINKSIASILILNTIANTLGAAAVGAQASKIWGDDVVAYVSIVLTFAILYFSEIIPKTIGAIYWKALAPLAAKIIQVFVFITYPIILTTLFVTDKISKGNEDAHSLTRDELLESMLLSEDEGVIDEKESDYIENVLKLDEMKVQDILTPRSVVFALEENRTVKEVLKTQPEIFKFSRIPVYNKTIDNVTGIILVKKLFKQALLKNDMATLKEIKYDMFSINENIPVAKAIDLFIAKKEHMFLVLDNYDQTEGIVTLEDCVETVLGIEIMDESDTTEDMRALAKLKMKQNRREKENLISAKANPKN